jgi:hypothetical protein
VKLDLVRRGHDLDARVGRELAQKRHAEVGDADRANLACSLL